ncbi:hypothetical protein ACFV3E_40740 [Streptomyces sp. NPDC059718]
MDQQQRDELDRATLSAALDAAMTPVVEQIRQMAKEQGRDPETVLASLPDGIFAPLAFGYLCGQLSGQSGEDRRRTAARMTARALRHDGHADLIPLAMTLGRYGD